MLRAMTRRDEDAMMLRAAAAADAATAAATPAVTPPCAMRAMKS